MAIEYIDGLTLRSVISSLSKTTDSQKTILSVVRKTRATTEVPLIVRFDATTECGDQDGEEEAPSQEIPTAEARRLMAADGHIRSSCKIAHELAAALEHAHGRGVVHRDLKPENVMIDVEGGVHIIDFGIARFLEDSTLTNTGGLVGTPMYMSPEQVSGRVRVDHRTDIYSLGLLLYELLTLQPPLSAPNREEILRQVVTKALRPVSWRNRAVSRELESVVHKATAKDPDERYQSSSEFALDLQNYLENRPVAAAPYRYRLDEREIAAERPRPMIFVSNFLFMIGALFLCLGPIYTSIIAAYAQDDKLMQRTSWVLWPVGTLAGIVLIAVAIGLLAGREWSRVSAIVALLVFIPAFLLIIRFIDPRVKSYGTYFRVLNNTLPFICILAVVPIVYFLCQQKTRNWFLFADRLRAEHRRQVAE
jgi:hypothetical protein